MLTRAEVSALLGAIDDPDVVLPARLLYGGGLRLLECLRLRVKDVDVSRREILVRDGKGQKDRVTMLPESLVQMLARVAQALDERQARPALWISHAGVARCVQWLSQQPAGQLPTAAQWTAPAPAFGAWMVFDARLPSAALPAGGGGHIG